MSQQPPQKDFAVIKLLPGQHLQIDPQVFAGQIKPVRLWIFPYGSKDNKPSLMFELIGSFGEVYIAQISEAMLAEGLRDADAMKILGIQ